MDLQIAEYRSQLGIRQALRIKKEVNFCIDFCFNARVLTFFAFTHSTFNFAIRNGLSNSRSEVGNSKGFSYFGLFVSAEYLLPAKLV